MNPLPDTPALFLAVPGHTRLFRRSGGTYYLRAKVPSHLRRIIGKTEIRESLRTKDIVEAKRLVKPASMRVDRLVMEAEAKLEGTKPAPSKLSREEISWIVADWFIKQEAVSEEWKREGLPKLDEEQRGNYVETLKVDCSALAPDPSCIPDDGSDQLDAFLTGEGLHWGIQKGSEDYKRLLPLFEQAQEESLVRTIYRVLGKAPNPHNPWLAKLHANTILPPAPRQTVAFGKFLDDFMDFQRTAYPKTPRTHYALPIRILREVIGEDTPLNTVSRHHLEKVFDLLCLVPVNMVQHYPGLSVKKAIEAAARDKKTRTLSPCSLQNNFILIKAVFNYAVDEQLISENPAKGRKNTKRFKYNRKKKQRPPFTIEELQKIFQAPLYTGCKDDERRYAKAGTEHPRRGRFWVPLLALFHGLRCNEACQLYAEDISEEKGIPYLHVRDDLEDEEEETDKRLKNEGSRRKVPIHPEILKMGFLDYVENIRIQEGSGRLFPTLKLCKSTGRYSKIFSKWFSRFLELSCGYKPKAVFHSFRHNFRAGLDKAKVQTSYVEMLGGWQPEGSSEIEYRHAELADLRDAIAQLSYPGLDLSHLYKPQDCNRLQNIEVPKTACRTRRRPAPYSPLQSGAE